MSTIPAGSYEIDTAHSEVGFSVRHSGIAKVRGRFTEFSGTFTVAEEPGDSAASVTIAANSVDTGNAQRDQHLTSADFWEAEKNPEWTFVSTAVTGDGEEFILHGDLTINGVTQPVDLNMEYNGAVGAAGEELLGFSITTQISRKEFGLTWNVALEGGGVLVGDRVSITIDVEAARAKANV